jgi:hypothetical protein
MTPYKKLTAVFVILAVLVIGAPRAESAIYHHWSETPAEIQKQHSPATIQSWIDAYWRQRWIEAYNWNRWMEGAARQQREEAARLACGGDLPPCSIVRRESKFDLRIWNGPGGGCYAPFGYRGSSSPCGGSTASGKFQFIRRTWNGYGGYVNAADAPATVQNAKAREVWAHGRGCSHWSAC